MKKIILLASGLILSFATFAQLNVEVMAPGGNHSLNDSTVVIYSPPLGGVAVHSIPFYVINNGALTLNVKIKRVDSAAVALTSNYLCWGIFCYGANPAPIWTTSTAESMTAHDTDKTFTSDYTDSGHVGTEIIRYVFFSAANPTDTAWFNVKYIISPLSVPQIAANALHISAPYPNPSANTVSFNLRVSADAHLTIYNSDSGTHGMIGYLL